MRFSSKGKIYTGKELGFTGSEKTWLILLCDKSISFYYMNQLSLHFKNQDISFTLPIAGPHISITRNENVDPAIINSLKRQSVTFFYDNYLHTNRKHWWLLVDPKPFSDIRKQCGLRLSPSVQFHMTVATQKKWEIKKSKASKEATSQLLLLEEMKKKLPNFLWDSSPEKEIYTNLLKRYDF